MIDTYLSGSSYRIDCNSSRWTVDNFGITFETWLKKADVITLRNNIRPGAVKELYNILGLPKYFDMSFSGGNTIQIIPNSNNTINSNLPYMRDKKVLYVKNITTSPIRGPTGWINVKIEAYTSSSAEL